MTKFADFIRNASQKEKERVYLKVIDAAIERQKACLKPPFITKR